MSDPVFLSAEQVLILHRISLEQHGGRDGVRDPNALTAAVIQPQHEYHYGHADLFEVAAAYAFHVAQSQSFIDGNKRTGMSAALVFLYINGVVVPSAADALNDAMIGIAERRLTKADLARLLRKLAKPH